MQDELADLLDGELAHSRGSCHRCVRQSETGWCSRCSCGDAREHAVCLVEGAPGGHGRPEAAKAGAAPTAIKTPAPASAIVTRRILVRCSLPRTRQCVQARSG